MSINCLDSKDIASIEIRNISEVVPYKDITFPALMVPLKQILK